MDFRKRARGNLILSEHNRIKLTPNFAEQTWSTKLNFLKDVRYRKIMRRADSLKVLFICVCVCTVCPAHPCGDNPLSVVDRFSRDRGLRSEEFMLNLRETTPETYNRLMSEYQDYMDCTRAVQTGYYKRSVDSNPEPLDMDSFLAKDSPQQPLTNLFKDAIRKMERPETKSESDSSSAFWDTLRGELTGTASLSSRNLGNANMAASSSMSGLPTIIKRLMHHPFGPVQENLLSGQREYPDV